MKTLRKKLFENAQDWCISEKKDKKCEPLPLTKLDFKLRIVISVFCFFYIFMECSNSNIYSTPCCLAFVPLWMLYLYLVIKQKSDFLTGFLGLIIIMAISAILMHKGGYCLRLIGSSLGILALFSVQGYSSALVLLMGLGYLSLQRYFFYHFENVYEPITQSYRIPAVALDGAVQGWTVALIIEILCLILYQFTLRKTWSNYQQTQRDLEESNQKLQVSNAQLVKTVDGLVFLNKQLKEALDSQDLFVSSVSHEFRNPLNVMLGGLDLLESQTKGESQAQQIIKASKLSGDSLLNQINNLLDVAKISAGKLEINTFSTKMSVFFDKFWTMARTRLGERGLSGCLTIDRKVPMWLEIDSLRLEQILNNLIDNSIKFTSKGSVRVTVTWEKEIIAADNANTITGNHDERDPEPTDELFSFRMPSENRIHVSKPTFERHNMKRLSDYMGFKDSQAVKQTLDETLDTCADSEGYVLKIDITDTGFGIPKEKQEWIFNPFIQADRSITRKYGGTGLGLYIVKSLVEKMEGSVKFTSLEEIGTQFQIILPVKPTEQPQRITKTLPDLKGSSLDTLRAQHTTQEEEINASKNGKVLIVDDDPFNQNLMKCYFKKLGFGSDTADNGLEGVQLYKLNPKKYTFITMDIQMPVMDGITATRMIRKYEKETNKKERIPIIMVTGNCSENEQTECLNDPKISANFFFRKPFRLSDCQVCVQKILESVHSSSKNTKTTNSV